jgi:ADP-ribose pyrophosphatase YjhB (NUDIX family)
MFEERYSTNYTKHDYYCNNCGKYGHNFNNCINPITSFGMVLFRDNPQCGREYLMICRKDTLGFIDFMRGKYITNNRRYITVMLNQMTVDEKQELRTKDFTSLWTRIWGDNVLSHQYRLEEMISRDKFRALSEGIVFKNEKYTLIDMIDESDKNQIWHEPEWGFPKGRRNYQEKEYDCAIREMTEETGYSLDKIINLKNILPFDEIFTGSNYKSYKHKYFLAYMDYNVSIKSVNFDKTEVGNMEWKTFEKCMKSIRFYNKEKIEIIRKIDNTLSTHNLFLDMTTNTREVRRTYGF